MIYLSDISLSGTGLTVPWTCPHVDDRFPYNALYDAIGIQELYDWHKKGSLECAKSPYNEPGRLLGASFAARDVEAIAKLLDDDGLIRYWGKSSGPT